jgi:hypothetical protein
VIGLNYTIFGDPHCPAILFLHGFMGSGADWADAISALEERFYCVAPRPSGAWPLRRAAARALHHRTHERSAVGSARRLRDRTPDGRRLLDGRAARAVPRAAPPGALLQALSGVGVAGDRRHGARGASPLERGEGVAVGVRQPREFSRRLVPAATIRVADAARGVAAKDHRGAAAQRSGRAGARYGAWGRGTKPRFGASSARY